MLLRSFKTDKDVLESSIFPPLGGGFGRGFMKIVFATGNAHKLQEINEIAQGTDIEFVLPPQGFEPVENGETFEENSLIKALEAARLSGMISLADDSGLCVEALNGAPGIYSARYADTAQGRINKLLKELENVPSLGGGLGRGLNRRAKFVCAMTLVDADGNILFQTRGECHGEIAKEQSGVNGFGYDPVFLIGEKTMAEMSEEEKNEISHRGIALRKVLEYLEKFPPLGEG